MKERKRGREAVFHTQQCRQKEPRRQILEALRSEWPNSAPHLVSIPERRNVNIKYFIFPSETQTCNLSKFTITRDCPRQSTIKVNNFILR